MTSISSSLAASTVRQSPRARMDARLEAATSAGTISKTDETALSGALDDIDKSLSASKPTGTDGTQAKSGDMKAKIDTLIDQEVKDGKLTDAQASELKDMFASNGPQQADATGATDGTDAATGAAATGKTQSSGHVHHGHHKKAASSDDDGTTTTSASSTDSSTTKLDTLISLLQKLRDSMASTDTYGGTTASANSTSQTALLVDKSA